MLTTGNIGQWQSPLSGFNEDKYLIKYEHKYNFLKLMKHKKSRISNDRHF